MKFCINTNFTLPKQSQRSRSVLKDRSRSLGLFWKENFGLITEEIGYMPSDCCFGPRPNTGVQGSAKFYWLITFTKHGVVPVYHRNLHRIIKKTHVTLSGTSYCPILGHLNIIHFPFGTNGKVLLLGVPVLQHIRVHCLDLCANAWRLRQKRIFRFIASMINNISHCRRVP